MATVDLIINANTKQAAKAVTKFGKSTTKAVKSIENSFSGLKAVAAGAVAFLGTRALINNVKELTAAAAIQEDAVNALNVALKTSGEFSREASQEFQDFASEIQKTTRFGDELVLNQIAIAKAYGATNEQAKQLVRGSIELAEAQGKSLDEAVRQVSKTLGGYAGELGEVLPAIKNLTAEQLKNGEVAQLLIDQYGGTAQQRVKTYSGALQQLSNSQGDLNEELGFTITKNPAVLAALKAINDGYQNQIDFIKENRDEVNEYIQRGVEELLDILPKSVRILGMFAQAWNILKFAVADVADAILFVNESIIKAERYIKSFNTAAEKPTNKLKKITDEIRIQKDETGKPISIKFEVDETDANAALEGIRKSRSELLKIRENAVGASNDMQLLFLKVEAGLVKTIKKYKEYIKQIKTSNKVSEAGETAGKVYADGFIGSLAKLSDDIGDLLSNIKFEDISKGLASAFADGKKGAKDLVVGLGAGIVDAFAPGIGQAIKPLLDSLALGPENAKAQAKAFAEELPQIVENIIEGLIEGLPALVDALVRVLIEEGGLVRIVDALVRATPRIAFALAESFISAMKTGFAEIMTISVERWKQGWRDNLAEWRTGMRDEFGENIIKLNTWLKGLNTTPKWVQDIITRLNTTPKWVQDLIDALSGDKIKQQVGLGGVSTERIVAGVATGGVSEVLIQTGILDEDKIPSLQTGGLSSGGLTNLHAGELVVPPSTTQNLFDAIDRMGGGDRQAAEGSGIAQILAILQAPITVETTAEIDGDAFADISLRLDRLNARVAV